ncbi:hypothetical protein COO60DRAFT_416932 [Scenedesmus sp. NREL 46B-D3]|nr:hypothetical protein COO60DRAFT_416932 [Scenedesmus sp. NREL 46B-D3]
MSQQSDAKPGQSAGQQVQQVQQLAASMPYQIAYIQMPAGAGAAEGQTVRQPVAVPFHIVPLLGAAQGLGGLQMQALAQLVQGQQVQAALFQDPARQGAVLMAQQQQQQQQQQKQQQQDAATSRAQQQGMLLGLDPAMRAALAGPAAGAAATAQGAAAAAAAADGQQNQQHNDAAAGSAAAGGAASVAAAAAGRVGPAAPPLQVNSASLLAAAFQVQGAAALQDHAAAAAAAVAAAAGHNAATPRMHKQKQQQVVGLDLSTMAAPEDAVAPPPVSAALEAAAVTAASRVPAAAEAAIAAAEAAAVATASTAAAANAVSVSAAAVPAGAAAHGQAGQQQALQQLQQHEQQQPQQPALQQHSSSREGPDQLLLDSDVDMDAADEQEEAAAAAGAADGAGGAAAAGLQPRVLRLKQRKVFNLKRKFAELTAQVEGALCEARAMSAWKLSLRSGGGGAGAAKLPRLDASERRMLAGARSRRLAEVASKQCLQVIKALMAHKFGYPFNSPVDVTKYRDYCSYVQQPMDFGTMRARAEEGGYAEPAQVYGDALLVFNNARRYNQPTEDVSYMATVLQEYFQERWGKLVAPKLQEEARQARAEEDALRQRKAAAARAAADVAAQEAACRLAGCLDELHEQLAQLRVQAALCCEPLPAAAREELATGLQALSQRQLEAALSLVLPRLMAAGESHLQQSSKAGGGSSRLEVEVDLARCSALELRQLQHFAAACQEANSREQQQRQRQRQQPAAAARDGGTEPAHAQPAGAGEAEQAPAAHADTQHPAPAGLQQLRDDAAAPAAAAGAGAGAGAAAGAAAGAGTPSTPTAGGFAAAAEQQEAAAAAAAAAGGESCARSMSGFPMVCVHEAPLSERAGIVWPGQVVGAGLKARARLLLAGQADQPPAPQLPPLAPPPAGGMHGSPAGHAAAAAAAAACAGLTAGMLGPPGKQSSYMAAKRRSSGTCRACCAVRLHVEWCGRCSVHASMSGNGQDSDTACCKLRSGCMLCRMAAAGSSCVCRTICCCTCGCMVCGVLCMRVQLPAHARAAAQLRCADFTRHCV